MWIEVSRIEYKKLSEDLPHKEDAGLKERIGRAREAQRNRFKEEKKPLLNSRVGVKEMRRYIMISDEVKNVLNSAAEKLDLSARAYHRVIKLARTIADLSQSEEIKSEHILEALQYRPRTILF